MTMIKYMKKRKKIKTMISLHKNRWKNSFKCNKEDKWMIKTISLI